MSRIALHQCDVLVGLRTLSANSVHCVVTSPPYWELRDYGVAGQLGLEKSPEEYLDKMVQVFREVRRVLRPDGTLWLNMGDTYHNADKWGGGGANTGKHTRAPNGEVESWKAVRRKHSLVPGLKAKDLCGIPWRLALALQADGWWLRRDIIWAKPNAMPESCQDRPTTAHEYIFLLTKSAQYFYDAEAVKEECCSGPSDIRKMEESKERIGGLYKDNEDLLVKASKHTNIGRKRSVGSPNGRNCRSVWDFATDPFPGAHFATFPPTLPERCIKAGTSEKGCCPKCGAPWVRVVEKGEAVSRPDNPNPVIPYDAQSGCTHGTGATTLHKERKSTTIGWRPTCQHYPRTKEWEEYLHVPLLKPSEEIAILFTPQWWRIYRIRVKNERITALRAELLEFWKDMDTVPCTVLDPFSGAGTTPLVAAKLGRNAVGIELKPDYVAMSVKRFKAELGMLAEIEVKILDP